MFLEWHLSFQMTNNSSGLQQNRHSARSELKTVENMSLFYRDKASQDQFYLWCMMQATMIHLNEVGFELK